MNTAEQSGDLTRACARLCQRFGVQQVYFARVFGRRRHYLGGYGAPLPERPRQMRVGAQLCAFWHGALSVHSAAELRRALRDLAATIPTSTGKRVP